MLPRFFTKQLVHSFEKTICTAVPGVVELIFKKMKLGEKVELQLWNLQRMREAIEKLLA